MARKLSNKVNVEPISPTYPYARVKDNPGDNTGTPVDELLVGDLIQFFEKIMDAAGVTFNNQPENNTSGFQFFTALIANIRATTATTALNGTSERATQTEVNTGTDSARHITPDLIAGATSIITTLAVQDLAITTAKIDALAVTTAKIAAANVTLAKMAVNSIDSDQYVDGSIDDAHFAEARVKSVGVQLLTTVVEIGDWNMDITATVNIPHGLTASNIRVVSAVIQNDASTLYSPSPATDTFLEVELTHNYNATNVVISRRTGGVFDSALYDATTFNRGWITITYEA